MPKHRVLRKRIDKEAQILVEFTTQELLHILNNYPNNHGYGVTNIQTSTNRLCNLLYANPKVITKKKYTSGETRTVWEYIGDEEE